MKTSTTKDLLFLGGIYLVTILTVLKSISNYGSFKVLNTINKLKYIVSMQFMIIKHA